MKQFRIFAAGVALSMLALMPAAAQADEEELDVTMEVLDDVGDIDGDVIVMPGPDDDLEGSGGDDREDGESADSGEETEHGSDDGAGEGADMEREFAGREFEDDFTHDEDFEADENEEHSEEESDFDEGETIDLDEPEEMPMEDDQPEHDEEQVEGGEI